MLEGACDYSDLATMDVDECLLHNRFLDALLEAKHREPPPEPKKR